MDHKGFKFNLKQIDEQGIFEGYAAVFGNEDLVGDIIEPGAFSKTLQENPKMPILWQHNPAEPIGVTLAATEDGKGLRVQGQLNLETTRGREAYALLKQGALKGLSIGYDTIKEAWDGTIRRLKEIRLWEWSLVTFPANPMAQVEGIKSVVPYQDLPLADEGRAWDGNAAVNRVREWAGGDKDNIDWNKYRKAFLWYDSENAENFGAYKLPIADVINGQLMAVPRGIMAAAAVIQGARGGVNIPDSDIPVIKRHLERYYTKMDKEPPWASKSIDMLLYAVIGASSEIKAGRVLSASNRTLVEQAIQALQALLAVSEPDDSTQKSERPSDEGKSDDHLLDDTIQELRKILKEVS
ncbi:HK97 family phage prohead protease [Thermoanaerobacterium thermosaccharolyticum]|uniref:HK97 family phage prohead protease n=1 Tax=Thermoanaerobacterium thermosaccharolyticum TaxID=1517 RepID=UPI003DA7F1DC